MKISFDYNSQSFHVDLTPTAKSFRATIEDKSVDVEVIRVQDGWLELLIDGERLITHVSSDNAKRWVTLNGQTFVLTKSSGAKRSGAGQDHASELAAPMPGVVRSVNVGGGESVVKGQTLLVLEAMKMEIRIQAPFDGLVKSLAVKVGQTVEREQILIVLERGKEF
jgi:acetyl/propionyl-CoA carboxylase alpha subunit